MSQILFCMKENNKEEKIEIVNDYEELKPHRFVKLLEEKKIYLILINEIDNTAIIIDEKKDRTPSLIIKTHDLIKNEPLKSFETDEYTILSKSCTSTSIPFVLLFKKTPIKIEKKRKTFIFIQYYYRKIYINRL